MGRMVYLDVRTTASPDVIDGLSSVANHLANLYCLHFQDPVVVAHRQRLWHCARLVGRLRWRVHRIPLALPAPPLGARLRAACSTASRLSWRQRDRRFFREASLVHALAAASPLPPTTATTSIATAAAALPRPTSLSAIIEAITAVPIVIITITLVIVTVAILPVTVIRAIRASWCTRPAEAARSQRCFAQEGIRLGLLRWLGLRRHCSTWSQTCSRNRFC
mmetsp:Transcript_158457/g.288973  ORF Transcript_158457/g.288973 Transcript_158457/m.288973 type:complete len:221 (-) Transcript_158457:1418-2080(-)